MRDSAMVETLDTARCGINGSRMLSALGEEAGEKPSWLWTIGVSVLAAVPRLTSLRAFLAHDETQYWEWARTFFFAVLHGDWLGTIVPVAGEFGDQGAGDGMVVYGCNRFEGFGQCGHFKESVLALGEDLDSPVAAVSQ